jgi:hypothetical protein
MNPAKRAVIEKHRMISLQVLPRSTNTTASASLWQIRRSPGTDRGLDSAVAIETSGGWLVVVTWAYPAFALPAPIPSSLDSFRAVLAVKGSVRRTPIARP